MDDRGGIIMPTMKKTYTIKMLPQQSGQVAPEEDIEAESMHVTKFGHVIFRTDGKTVAVVARHEFQFIKEK